MKPWFSALVLLVIIGTVPLQSQARTDAQGPLDVVATTTNMAMLAQTVGGEAVSVQVLAPPDRDPHYLDVRPNMMVALRRADLVVSVGAELETGWLPPAMQGAANPAIQPGRSGYFEAAAQVERIGVHGIADRAMGDVHPEGNPHVYMDPVRMVDIARVLAGRMGELDPGNATAYGSNADAFAAAVESRLPDWKRQAESAPGAVLFHEDADYLLARLDVPVLGYMEPVPGMPPTASHLRSLVRDLEGREGVIIHSGYQPSQGPEFLADALGWEVHVLPTNVAIGGTAEDYLALLDRWVEALAAPAHGMD